MSQPFDPYHKWLAIPPTDQPANHYRLLGIAAYEADADVIANAADQRMAHLKSFQSGQYAALSQKLLNEVAAARACLLDPPSKQRYDAHLQGAPQPGQVTEPAGAPIASVMQQRGVVPPQPGAAPADGIQDVSISVRGRQPRATSSKQLRATKRRTRKFSILGHVIVPIAAIFFGYVILCIIKPEYSPFGSTDNKDNLIEDIPQKDGGVDAEPPSTDGRAVSKKVEPPSTGRRAVRKNVTPPSTGRRAVRKNVAPPSTGGRAVSKKVEPPSTRGPADIKKAEPPGRSDDRPSTAKSSPRQPDLATLEAKRDKALADGNIQSALNTIAMIAALNGENALQQQINALEPIAEAAQTSHDHQTVALASLMLTNRAVAQGQLSAARKLAVMALGNARRTPNQSLVNRVSLRLDEIKRLSASD